MRYALILLLAAACVSASAAGADPGVPSGRQTVTLEPVSIEETYPTGDTPIELNRAGYGRLLLGPEQVAHTLIYKDDKVFVDLDGNGHVNAEDGAGAKRGGRISLPYTYAGKPTEYVLFLCYAGPRRLIVSGSTCLQGRAGKMAVTVFDANANGIFGEERDRLRFGSEGPGVRITKVVARGADLLVPTFDGPGGKLHFDPYSGEKATLAFRTGQGELGVSVSLREKTGRFYCDAKIGSGPVAALPGEYMMGRVLLTKLQGESRQAVATLSGGQGNPLEPIVVKPGANELLFGPPFELEFSTAFPPGNAADALKIQAVDLVGAAGERYRAKAYGGNSRLECLVRAGQTEKKLASMDYG